MRKQRSHTLSQERLKEVLEYSPVTGKLSWKRGFNDKRKMGKPPGFVGAQGYVQIMIDRIPYHAHRLAWLFVYGEWPYEMISFINGDKTDTRIKNLRLKVKGSPKDPKAMALERVREVLDYAPETGLFTWKVVLSQRTKIGSIAGALNKIGYRNISVDGCHYLAHRLAWFWVHGSWPENMIDHVNGDRDDNRIENLRKATASQNSLNGPLRATNTSGLKGVSYSKSKKKWTARIMRDYRVYVLGYFPTKEEAYLSYCEAAQRLHGEFARI